VREGSVDGLHPEVLAFGVAVRTVVELEVDSGSRLWHEAEWRVQSLKQWVHLFSMAREQDKLGQLANVQLLARLGVLVEHVHVFESLAFRHCL